MLGTLMVVLVATLRLSWFLSCQALGSIADPFSSATLRFLYNGTDGTGGIAPPNYNADLYGLDSRAELDPVTGNPVSLANDYFVGPGPDATDATLLQDNLLTINSRAGFFDVDVVDYLNDQYDGGAAEGDFIFFRFSPDFNPNATIPDSRDAYLIASANSIPQLQPTITFTTVTAVPEPSTMGVLLLGATLLCSRRRRCR